MFQPLDLQAEVSVNIKQGSQADVEKLGCRERYPALLVLANDDWGDYWQTRYHIVSRLAQRGWPVFYTRNIFSRWHVGKTAWRHSNWRLKREYRDGINFYWPGRVHTGWPRFAKLDYYLRRWQMRGLLRDMAGVPKKPPVAYLFHPHFVHYLDLLAGFKIVYHADDTFSAMGKFSPELHEQERELVERADLVIASSRLMAEALPLPNGKKVIVIPNGADSQAFENAGFEPAPAVLCAIPTPRIGYIGSINDKVDLERIAGIAEARPDWHWCLVGRLLAPDNFQESTLRGLERCRQLPNVHFLGEFRAQELPVLVNHMNVNTMIYRTGGEGWWKNVSPLKMHEYLATGKPVVSAHVDAVLEFSAVVDIVPENSTTEDWVACLEGAINGDGAGDPGLRRQVARANDWNNKIDVLAGLLRAL